jgi:hypothetical protein
MLVRVLHNAGYYDYVKPSLLDNLIENQKIVSFYRQTGVVVLGVDKVRARSASSYSGPERRLAA